MQGNPCLYGFINTMEPKMQAQPHTPAPKARRLADMSDKELLAHTKGAMKRAEANGHYLAASVLAVRLLALKAKIRDAKVQS